MLHIFKKLSIPTKISERAGVVHSIMYIHVVYLKNACVDPENELDG